VIDKIQCPGSDLCNELGGVADTSFHATYQGDPPSRHVYGTRHFRLIVDLSPLVAGHMLLLPNQHHLNFGQIIIDNGDELRDLLDLVLPAYRNAFGPPAILEHGSSSDMSLAGCITHAHWHLVPVDAGAVDQHIVRDGLVQHHLTDISDLHEWAIRDEPYYYCSNGCDHTVYSVSRNSRRQYLRSVIGAIVGIPEPLWDYALVVRRDLLRHTVHLASGWAFFGLLDQGVHGVEPQLGGDPSRSLPPPYHLPRLDKIT
jgi:diadenosine tetraphosphate (Ap4A) HIT family hydrolase